MISIKYIFLYYDLYVYIAVHIKADVLINKKSQQNDVISREMAFMNTSPITFHTDPLNGYLLHNTALDSFSSSQQMRQDDKPFQ